MARGGNSAKPALNELATRALKALRKGGTRSDQPGMKQLQPKGGAAAFLAKELKVSPRQAGQAFTELVRQGLASSKHMGPQQPRMILVATQGQPEAAAAAPKKPKRSTTRKPAARKPGRRSSGGARQPARRRSGGRRATTRQTLAPQVHTYDELADMLKVSHQEALAQVAQLTAEQEALQSTVTELEALVAELREKLGAARQALA